MFRSMGLFLAIHLDPLDFHNNFDTLKPNSRTLIYTNTRLIVFNEFFLKSWHIFSACISLLDLSPRVLQVIPKNNYVALLRAQSIVVEDACPPFHWNIDCIVCRGNPLTIPPEENAKSTLLSYVWNFDLLNLRGSVEVVFQILLSVLWTSFHTSSSLWAKIQTNTMTYGVDVIFWCQNNFF